MNSKSFRTLFRRIGRALGSLSEEELAPVDAAIIDVPGAVRKIYEGILPEIDAMIGNGVVKTEQLFDLLMDMKVELDHIRSHLDRAVPALEKLLSTIAEMEKRHEAKPKQPRN